MGTGPFLDPPKLGNEKGEGSQVTCEEPPPLDGGGSSVDGGLKTRPDQRIYFYSSSIRRSNRTILYEGISEISVACHVLHDKCDPVDMTPHTKALQSPVENVAANRFQIPPELMR